MPVRFNFTIGVFFIAIIGGPIYAFFHCPDRGELFDKSGWSILQGMDDPPSPMSKVVLMRKDAFAVLGFRGVGRPQVRIYGTQPHWSWMLLDEHHAHDEIKQMPSFDSYDLPCSKVAQIEQVVPDADPYAIRYLRSICTNLVLPSTQIGHSLSGRSPLAP